MLSLQLPEAIYAVANFAHQPPASLSALLALSTYTQAACPRPSTLRLAWHIALANAVPDQPSELLARDDKQKLSSSFHGCCRALTKRLLRVQDSTEDATDVQQLKLELAGYQACCKQLGEELADRDRELKGQSVPSHQPQSMSTLHPTPSLWQGAQAIWCCS